MNIVLYIPKKNVIKIYLKSKVYTYNQKKDSISSCLDLGDILLIESLSIISKTQLLSWLALSSWFDKFKPLSTEDAENLPILFYDSVANVIRFCDPERGLFTFKLNSQKLLDLSDTYMAYIESAHLLSQKQFLLWLNSGWEPQSKIKELTNKPKVKQKYIHPVNNGTILIEDIKTGDEPLKLSGQYHFIPIDSIGEDRLKASVNYQILLKKGKIEIVDEEYVEANKHKYKTQASLNSTLPVGSVSDFLDQEENSDIPTINII